MVTESPGKRSGFTILTSLLAVILFSCPMNADNWPRWLGPFEDSTWAESGIVTEFPPEGLSVKWRSPISLGYSGPSVVDGKVFVMDYTKASGDIANKASWKDALEGVESVRCYDAANGELIWKYEYPKSYEISYGGGPRCTPTVADGKVYALGAEGDLHCLDADSGTLVWKKSFREDYGVETPIWGFAAHPFVDGNTLYCVVGGEGSVAVAFDKDTGKEKWRALSAPEPGYCPPTIINAGGVRQLIIWHPESVNSLDPATGSLYWSQPLNAPFRLSVIPPRLRGNLLFVSSQNDTGFMLKLSKDRPAAEVLWKSQPGIAASTVAATSVFTENAVYACDVQSSSLIAFDPFTGKRFWQTKVPTIGEEQKGRHGANFIVRHKPSDRYFILSETGDLILAKLSPERYEELGRVKAIEPTKKAMGRSYVWSHPAYANQSIYLRNDKELICYDLAAKNYETIKP